MPEEYNKIMMIWEKLSLSHPRDFGNLPDAFIGKYMEYKLAQNEGLTSGREENKL